MEDFLRYRFGDLYLEGLIHGGAYFRNFKYAGGCGEEETKKCLGCFKPTSFPSVAHHLQKQTRPFTVWENGKQNSGLENFVPEFVQISSIYQKRDHEGRKLVSKIAFRIFSNNGRPSINRPLTPPAIFSFFYLPVSS